MDAQRGGTALEVLDSDDAGSGAFRVPAPAPQPRNRKGAPRAVPQRDDAYAHLTLDGLRAYRRALAEEENRVSYWRRILQARLDLLRAGMEGSTARAVDTEALKPVLTDARVGAGRRVLVDVMPAEDMPPLPQLEQLWQRHADPHDTEAATDLERSLAQAERQLSDYRSALHRRIAEATGELIARYRETPSLCLSVLPLGRKAG
jgi:hypothetical protein